MIINQFIIAIFQWLMGNAIAFYFTEVVRHPRWLDFAKVMYCRKCFTFWFNTFTYICLYIATNHQNHYYLGLGLILTILTAIAMHIDEKHNTIDID